MTQLKHISYTGKKRHKEHRGEYARLYPEQKEIDHIAPLSVFEAYRHDEYGNADDETEQKGAKARFDFTAREDGDHARRKGDERRAVERDRVIGGKVREVIDGKHHQREDDIQKYRVAHTQKKERQKR